MLSGLEDHIVLKDFSLPKFKFQNAKIQQMQKDIGNQVVKQRLRLINSLIHHKVSQLLSE